jgi:hypothetical protein
LEAEKSAMELDFPVIDARASFGCARLSQATQTFIENSFFYFSEFLAAGLRQAMQTFGGLVGATVAGLTFRLSGSNYILTFAMASIPAVIALGLIQWVSTQDLTGHPCRTNSCTKLALNTSSPVGKIAQNFASASTSIPAVVCLGGLI